MKLTKRNIKILRKGATPLQKEAIDYVLDRWGDYQNKNSIFSEVLNHGCISGIVGNLIYYSQTLAFFEKHKNEINKLLIEILDETGETNPAKLFRDWDNLDPLATETHNQNLLAWFGFEETLRRVAQEFDGEGF